jgi:hypothetical protein
MTAKMVGSFHERELKQRMTVDEFIPWAMAQERGRYALINGEVGVTPSRNCAVQRDDGSDKSG